VPTAIPTPTAGPLDNKYGVIAIGGNKAGQLSQLGFPRFIDYTSVPVSGVPVGNQVIFISTVNPVATSQITQAAADFPSGSTWYVIGEPNARGASVGSVLAGLHDTYELILSLDSTAVITSPSILNYSYTCANTCGGYPTGASWIEDFTTDYMLVYGQAPPVDIWAIDVFPIAWGTEHFPTVNSAIVIDQLTELRAFLNGLPAEANKPIWVTEFGLHWGYADWTFTNPDCNAAYPAGAYQTESVKQYLREVYQWLDANSVSSNIEAWFTFSTHRDLTACFPDGGYGMTLFDKSGSNYLLSEIGDFYWNWSHDAR